MGLLFCVDYSEGCGVHYGVLDTDQSGDLTPDDTVVSAEGRRPPYEGMSPEGLFVDSFFDVFVEVYGLPDHILPNNDNPDAPENWNFWMQRGLYTVTDNNTPAKTLMTGIAGPSFLGWLYNELTMPAEGEGEMPATMDM